MSTPIRLAEGVWRVPTVGRNLVSSFVFAEADGSVTLVDCGLKGSGPRRVAAGLAALGKQPGDVRRILLTHAHADHAGGAARVQRHGGGGARIETHDDEARWLSEGRAPHVGRASVLGRLLDTWRPKIEVCVAGATFSDNQLLDVAGGLRVLHTPGHTLGHCSFLHERTGVLITGDSLFNFRDRMSWSYAFFCTDFPLSKQTAERLGEVDYEVAAFTHGAELRTDAREKVRDFLRRKSAR
jgi:glyoxylase-like metal-dependent hydrolase (beta-lactamase superfamily II)